MESGDTGRADRKVNHPCLEFEVLLTGESSNFFDKWAHPKSPRSKQSRYAGPRVCQRYCPNFSLQCAFVLGTKQADFGCILQRTMFEVVQWSGFNEPTGEVDRTGRRIGSSRKPRIWNGWRSSRAQYSRERAERKNTTHVPCFTTHVGGSQKV